MMKKLLATTTALLLLAPTFQAQAITALEVVEKAQLAQGKAFKGRKTLTVTRRSRTDSKATEDYPAEAEITYINPENYSIKIISPSEIAGIEFHMKDGVNSAYFPDEKLYLFNGGKNTSALPESIILGRITDNFPLLKQNYTIQMEKEDDFVRANQAYRIVVTPKNNSLTPRRKFWVDKENFQVLREDRFWGSDSNEYARSEYKLYTKFDAPPAIAYPNPPQDIRRVNLSGQEKNSFLTYSSIADAESREKVKILAPKYLPSGFQLKNIQVFTLFGARIQLLNYTDGINNMLVTIRPQQNFFVTLLAGAFSLNLIQKISRLSFHAPNNYAPLSTATQVAVAFGDVHSEELKKVVASIPMAN